MPRRLALLLQALLGLTMLALMLCEIVGFGGNAMRELYRYLFMALWMLLFAAALLELWRS